MEQECLWSTSSFGVCTSVSQHKDKRNPSVAANSVFGVTSGISAMYSVQGIPPANLTKACLDTSGVSSIVKIEPPNNLSCSSPQSATQHQMNEDQHWLDTEIHQDNCACNTSPIDSGIDIISPNPGSCLLTTNKSSRTLLSPDATLSVTSVMSSAAFFSQTSQVSDVGIVPLTSHSLNLPLCSPSSPSSVIKEVKESVSISYVPAQDLNRKRTLSESVPSSMNKMRIISPQSSL